MKRKDHHRRGLRRVVAVISASSAGLSLKPRLRFRAVPTGYPAVQNRAASTCRMRRPLHDARARRHRGGGPTAPGAKKGRELHEPRYDRWPKCGMPGVP